MHLMNEIIERMQLGMVTNYIAYFNQVPQSCNHFQRSIEGILSQPNPPLSRQRNNDNQRHRRQSNQDNRHRYQQPRARRKDRSRQGGQYRPRQGGGGLGKGSPPLVNKNGWICCRYDHIRRFYSPQGMSTILCKRCTTA